MIQTCKIITHAGEASFTLIFDDEMSAQGYEFVLTIVKGLEHKYPNEINNTNKVVAADLLLEWFKKWSL